MRNAIETFLLLALAGLGQACFALPVKYFRRWRWEHMWIAQAVTTNVLFPLLWAALLPATFWQAVVAGGAREWFALMGWGILWGTGGVAYGLALTRLGASFAYSFVFGITILAGAGLPALAHLAPAANPTRFAAGLAVGALATLLCALGTRDAVRQNATPEMSIPFVLRSWPKALLLGVAAGLFSTGYGLAFTLHFDRIQALVERGMVRASAPMVVNLPIYLGAACAAAVFAGPVVVREHSSGAFLRSLPLRNWALALAMGLFGIGSLFLYSVATTRPGHPPPNASYGVFMSFFVVGGNLIGVLTGELRSRSALAGIVLATGIGGIIAGALLLHSS